MGKAGGLCCGGKVAMTEPRQEAVERWPEGFAPSSPLSQEQIDEAAEAAIADQLNEIYMTVQDRATVWAEAAHQLQARSAKERRAVADTDPAIAGVESCGCITYVNSRPDQLNGDDRRTLTSIIESGGEVRRATVSEIKADPNFFPSECPHDPKGWERNG